MLTQTLLYVLNLSVLLIVYILSKSTVFSEDILWVNTGVMVLAIISTSIYLYACIKSLKKD